MISTYIVPVTEVVRRLVASTFRVTEPLRAADVGPVASRRIGRALAPVTVSVAIGLVDRALLELPPQLAWS